MATNETAPVYFHIGYSKTATKTLQGGVFPRLERLHLWGNGPLVSRNNDDEQRRAITLLKELAWSDTWDAAEPKWQELRAAAVSPDDRISFASYETLSGAFYHPRSDGLENCRRLHELFPTMRVILTIREQRSMLRSVYAHYVRTGGPASRAQFIDGGIVEPQCLLYDDFVREVQSIIGADNVKVLLFEELAQAPERFLATLGEFVGVEGAAELADAARRREHASLAPSSLAWMRVVNRRFARSELQDRPLLRSELLHRVCHAGVVRVVNPAVVRFGRNGSRSDAGSIPRAVADEVATSNTALAARCGLPLEQYGYLLA